jgi:glycerol-3-phosphate dehydrogenase
MSPNQRLNKKLKKEFFGNVYAELKDKCLFLTGNLHDWDDIVRAGLMSVNKKKYTVVNDINFTGGAVSRTRLPFTASNSLSGKKPDVLIIGGGIIGCSIARELTRYKLDVMLVEKEQDVALHASGRNNGIIHPGLGLRKGQLKKKYNDVGNRMYPQLCSELNVPFKYTGQYLCFTDGWMKPAVIASLLYWKYMGIPAKYISRKKLKEKEPHLSDKIKYALYFPTAGVVRPHGLTMAYAENAVNNGAQIFLDTAVIDIDVWKGNIKSVLTNHGRIYPKLVINAAGVFTDEIARLAGDHFYSIHPRSGMNVILDKKYSYFVNSITSLFSFNERSAAKGVHSKGSCIVHTIDDNLLVGPDAVETYEKEDYSIHRRSMETILDRQRESIPELSERNIITYFTGIRAVTYEEDFIVSFGRHTFNIIHVAGVQSPGLTAAPAIAVDVSKMAAEYFKAAINKDFNPIRNIEENKVL